jgi:hypothetical protein
LFIRSKDINKRDRFVHENSPPTLKPHGRGRLGTTINNFSRWKHFILLLDFQLLTYRAGLQEYLSMLREDRRKEYKNAATWRIKTECRQLCSHSLHPKHWDTKFHFFGFLALAFCQVHMISFVSETIVSTSRKPSQLCSGL